MIDTDQAALEGLEGDEKIILEAKQRFRRCEEWEADARSRFKNDLKFAEADSDNGYQWPSNILQDRGQRPCLTVNKTRQHNLQIINDMKKNKPSVKVRPTGGGATFESAQIYEGVVRHIEYNSNAQVAYDTASNYQVKGGIGYWRVITDYANEDTFDQEIFIRRIKNTLSVYLDMDISEQDGSDARYGFIFDDIPNEEFIKKYPESAHIASQTALGNTDNWLTKDHIRVAEYYRRTEKKDKLVAIENPENGEITYIRKSLIAPAMRKYIKDGDGVRSRDIITPEIEWFLIAGSEIIDRKPWPGKYIPIVRVIGEETIIDGQMDRKGHTRALKDPQRMYNYNASASVEYGALQSKSPYIAPAEAIEGYETYWNSANTTNLSVLIYNSMRDDGSLIPAPARQVPPQGATIYMEGMTTADAQMMMASGQYEANFGRKSNETSGKAIDAREHQGDDAVFHFTDNQAIGIRFTGKILIDLIPKIYDTPRIIRIMAEDGSESTIQLDPESEEAHQQIAEAEKEKNNVSAIFNPNVGQYDVVADVGPAYATRKQEEFNALVQTIKEAPELMPVIGDLLFKSADFPNADKIAERLHNMIPPQALGEGANPEVAQAQAQVQAMQGALSKALEELAATRLEVKAKAADKDVNEYKAITDRLDVLFNHIVVTPKDKATMLHDVMMEEQKISLKPEPEVQNASSQNEAQETASSLS